jgi:hypothetical protein
MLRILCAIAFVLLGFSGHHAAGAEGAAGDYYQLPDGSYASLCEPGGKDESQAPADHCKTCLIAQPHGAPAPDLAALDAPVFTLLGLNEPAPRGDITPKSGYRRMASRGPPLAV